MANGDVDFTDQYNVDVQEKVHDQENDQFKYAIITSAITPAQNDPDPRWGVGGGTNYSTSEVTPGGNYVAGGAVLANPSVTLQSGAGVWDSDDVSIAQNGANPTDGRRAVIYNDTDPGKRVLAVVDFGSVINLSSGAFQNIWNASGISQISKSA